MKPPIPVIAGAALMMLMISGCGITKTLFHHKSSKVVSQNLDKNTLWHFRFQYVKIVPQDACPTGPAVPNSQPAQISPAVLNAALAALRIIAPDSDKPIPLFNPAELNRIVGPIAKGLSKCSAHEDVAFTVLGAHAVAAGYQNVVTAGRLFLVKNRLNLILGSIHVAAADYDSRHNAKPTDYSRITFPQGSRCQAADSAYTVAASPPVIVRHDEAGAPRKDWVAIDLSNPAKLGSATAPENRNEAPPRHQHPHAGTEPATPPSVAPPTGAAAAPSTQHLARPSQQGSPWMQTAPSSRSTVQDSAHRLEERFELLKRLWNENLITDKDYKEKKQALLNEL